MFKLVLKNGVILTFLITSAFPAFGMMRPPEDPDGAPDAAQVEDGEEEGDKVYDELDDKDKRIIDRLKEIKDELEVTERTDHGSDVSFIGVYDQIFTLMEEANELVFEKSKYERMKQLTLLSDVFVTAVINLYKTRGRTSTAKPGWNLSNRFEYIDDLMDRLVQFLEAGVLDASMKKTLTDYIENYKYNEDLVKMQAGFPPAFTIIEDENKNRIVRAINDSDTAETYDYDHTGGGIKTLAELIKRDIKDPGLKDAALKFAGSVENNFYDRAVKIAKDPTRDFPEFYGRDEETAKIIETLSKLEKAHSLLTGKAGVGKTTLMKILQFGLFKGDFSLADGEEIPIILELPITDITNPSDPSVLTDKVKIAKAVAEALGRKIILFVDEAHISTKMTRNAIKGFLTEAFDGDENSGVHMVFATTSSEARDFLGDSAFVRRWDEIFIREFSNPEVVDLVKLTHLNRWIKHHKRNGQGFTGIDEDAFEFAAKYGRFEQPHAGNPTGAKELLEAAIARKVRLLSERDEGLTDFTLTIQDLRDYLKSKMKTPLIPGDPEFEEVFDRLWGQFNEKYVGNDGLKSLVKDTIRKHFITFDRKMMTAALNAGPPGAGKTYLAEVIAEIFFNGAIEVINGGEYKNGGLELNKLIGSPSGTVGSEEQRGIIPAFVADNPDGGILVIEEGDYVHQDVYQFLTNMISKKEFKDGLGRTWDMTKYMIIVNHNQGQELMIPKGANNKMTWEDRDMKVQSITEDRQLGDGSTVQVIKPEILDQVMEDFATEVVSQSTTVGDVSVDQELAKQKRRYTSWYTLLPSKEDLFNAAVIKLKNFVEGSKLDYGVEFEIAGGFGEDGEVSEEMTAFIDDIIDVEKFDFEKGYSYVDEQIDLRLFDKLSAYYHLSGEKIEVSLEPDEIEIAERIYPSHKLIVERNGERDEYKLGFIKSSKDNPWGSSDTMRENIRNFARNMKKYLVGHRESIKRTHAQLIHKAVTWSQKPVVITKLGTTGNGKTEYFKSMAKALFGSSDDLFTITGVDHKWDLNDYFRPPTGVQGGREETEFEKWFISRKHKGGVILFDELLSFDGLTKIQVSERIGVLNELYQLLDEGVLQIGSKKYDASKFIVGITGNLLQEAFKGIPDDPSSEKLIKKIKEKLTRSQIVKVLGDAGLDPPKVARLGQIDVEGPLMVKQSQKVGRIKVNNLNNALKADFEGREILIDEKLSERIVNELTTLELGMREVERGLKHLVEEQIANILFYFPNTKKIEVKLEGDDIKWYIDDTEVIQIAEIEEIEETGDDEEVGTEWIKAAEYDADEHRVVTPQLKDLDKPEKLIFSDESLRVVLVHELYGHWMVNNMLTRKNHDSDISLIPGDGYLGYVRQKEKKEQDIEGLSGILKEIVVLQAGHRAVIRLLDLYETGGGNGDLEKKLTDRNDDVSKVIRQTNRIISNQLVDGIAETTEKKDLTKFRNLISRLSIRIADYMVLKGYKSGVYQVLDDSLMKDRYLGEEQLDAFVEGMDYTQIAQDEYSMFIEALVSSVEDELESAKLQYGDKEVLKIVVDNLFTETRAAAKLKLPQDLQANAVDFINGMEAKFNDIYATQAYDSSSPFTCQSILSH